MGSVVLDGADFDRMMSSSGSLNRADLADYRARFGSKCPTPQDAMRFAMLSMMLGKVLSPKNVLKYNESLSTIRKAGSSTKEVQAASRSVRDLDAKMIGATDEYKQKVAQKTAERSVDGLRILPQGTHVRLKLDVDAKGILDGWPFTHASAGYRSEEVLMRATNVRQTVARPDLITICVVCDADAPKVCSRCKSVFYCSRDCQVGHWKDTHKGECKAMAEKLMKRL